MTVQQPKKYVIVTGATGAIGSQICLDLYRQGYNLILACRNGAKAEYLAKGIMEDDQRRSSQSVDQTAASDQTTSHATTDILYHPAQPRDPIIFLDLDLCSKRKTLHAANDVKVMVNDRAGAGINGDIGKLEIIALINNAGIMCRNFGLNIEGEETTMAVNYHNTKLFTESVMPLMPKGSQIIFTTSVTRIFHRHHLKAPIITKRKFSQLGTYGLSKRMITDFAASIAKEYPTTGIRVNCADPGVVDSGMITMHRWFDPLADKIFRPHIRTPQQGAQCILNAFSSDQNGKIFFLHNVKDLI